MRAGTCIAALWTCPAPRTRHWRPDSAQSDAAVDEAASAPGDESQESMWAGGRPALLTLGPSGGRGRAAMPDLRPVHAVATDLDPRLAQEDHGHRPAAVRLGRRGEVLEAVARIIALEPGSARSDDHSPLDGKATAVIVTPVAIDHIGESRRAGRKKQSQAQNQVDRTMLRH